MRLIVHLLLGLALSTVTAFVAAVAVDAGRAVAHFASWVGQAPWPAAWNFATASGVEAAVGATLVALAAIGSNLWAVLRPGGASVGALVGLMGAFSFHASRLDVQQAPGWLLAAFLALLFVAPVGVAGLLHVLRPGQARRLERAIQLRHR